MTPWSWWLSSIMRMTKRRTKMRQKRLLKNSTSSWHHHLGWGQPRCLYPYLEAGTQTSLQSPKLCSMHWSWTRAQPLGFTYGLSWEPSLTHIISCISCTIVAPSLRPFPGPQSSRSFWRFRAGILCRLWGWVIDDRGSGVNDNLMFFKQP